MADKNPELKIEFNGVTLEKDPEAYCKMLYAEAASYQEEKLKDINIENRLFFEGHDKLLEDRAIDKTVVRSSMFINEVKPAIDTRVAGVLTKIEETGNPILVKPKSPNPTKEEKDQAKWISLKLTQQLRDSGYLSGIFEEQIVGSEIYRSPSAVKVGWETEEIKVPVVITPSDGEITEAASLGQPVPVERVEYRDEIVGKPYVEWLDTDEFLYDPHSSSLERDCNYTIHAGYHFLHDVVAMAHDQGWDVDKVKEYGESIGDDNTPTVSASDSVRDDLRSGRDDAAPERGYRDGKLLVAEFYVKTYSDQGQRQTRKIVMIGDKTKIFDSTNELKEITHPFVLARSNPLPGTLENFSSVDLGKRLGRFVNEVYNSWVDGTTYSMFSIQKCDADARFSKPPIHGPGKLWYISPNKEAIAPAMPFQIQIPELTSLITFSSSRLRQLLNSPDLAEGFNATPNEKATSSNLRAAGSARRFVPINRRYGDALIGVAWMFLKLNRQYAPDAARFVMDVDIDAPTLTNVTNTENEKQEELLLLSQMTQLPLYQSPGGLRKMRNQIEDIVRLIKDNHANVNDYVPTPEELDKQIGLDTERANLERSNAGALGQQQIQGGQ